MARISPFRDVDWATLFDDGSGQLLQREASNAASMQSDETGSPVAWSGIDEAGTPVFTPVAVETPVQLDETGQPVAWISTDETGALVAQPQSQSLSPFRAAAEMIQAAVEAASVVTPDDAADAGRVRLQLVTPEQAREAEQPVAVQQSIQATAVVSASASPTSTTSTTEQAAIRDCWNSCSATDAYRVYQQMSEHGWSAADVAAATGQSEQAVGDWLTRIGAEAGFGGSVTVGRGIDDAFMASLNAARSDASSPYTHQIILTDESGAALHDESGAALSRTEFDSVGFAQSYLASHADFARIHGAVSGDGAGGLAFASGAHLRQSVDESGSSTGVGLDWAADGRISAYQGFAKGNVLEQMAMGQMVRTATNDQILAQFGDPHRALPNNELGERMRALYGTDLATYMLNLQDAVGAMKGQYLADVNAALYQATSPQALGITAPIRTDESGQQVYYDESGAHVFVPTSFDAAAFQASYAQQGERQALIVQALGAGVVNANGSGFDTAGGENRLCVSFSSDESGGQVAQDVTLSSRNYTTVDIARPPDLYSNAGVWFEAGSGYITNYENIKPDEDWLDQLVPIVIMAAAAWFSAGTLGPAAASSMGLTVTGSTALTASGLVVSAAVAGAATSMVGGALSGNLSLEGILKGALTGALTAGLANGLDAVAGSTLSGMGTAGKVLSQTLVQGTVSTLMGGSFEQGAVAGLTSGLAASLANTVVGSINAGISASSADWSIEQINTARMFSNMVGAAIKVVAMGEGANGYALARAFLDTTFAQIDPPKLDLGGGSTVTQGAGPWSSVEYRNGADVDSDAVAETHVVASDPAPIAEPVVVTVSDQAAGTTDTAQPPITQAAPAELQVTDPAPIAVTDDATPGTAAQATTPADTVTVQAPAAGWADAPPDLLNPISLDWVASLPAGLATAPGSDAVASTQREGDEAARDRRVAETAADQAVANGNAGGNAVANPLQPGPVATTAGPASPSPDSGVSGVELATVVITGKRVAWDPSQPLAYNSNEEAVFFPLGRSGDQGTLYVNGRVDAITGTFSPGTPSVAELTADQLDAARQRLDYLNANYDEVGLWHSVKDVFGFAKPVLTADQLAESQSLVSILEASRAATSETSFVGGLGIAGNVLLDGLNNYLAQNRADTSGFFLPDSPVGNAPSQTESLDGLGSGLLKGVAGLGLQMPKYQPTSLGEARGMQAVEAGVVAGGVALGAEGLVGPRVAVTAEGLSSDLRLGNVEGPLQTGGRQVLNPNRIEGWDAAESAYTSIRSDRADIAAIAQNTGMPEATIARIKAHVFDSEHLLDTGLRRFDADPNIVNAWSRLQQGDFLQSDLVLLSHERFESKFESLYKTNYRTAHDAAERTGRVWIPE